MFVHSVPEYGYKFIWIDENGKELSRLVGEVSYSEIEKLSQQTKFIKLKVLFFRRKSMFLILR